MIRKLTREHRSHIVSARDLETSEKRRQVLHTYYDACVIGSGPGGAVAAATLAQSGLKVLLVEKGPFVPQEQINFRVLDMSNRFGHVETTSGYRTVLYQGSALGGSSMIFGAVAMKPKQFVFDEWRQKSGIAEINADTLEPHYQHVAEVMSVKRQTHDLETTPAVVISLGSIRGEESRTRQDLCLGRRMFMWRTRVCFPRHLE